ncbi:MAG: amidohydrolase family protein [Spongiibacteraceae bacterium]|jgi:2,3-dihydroxybenzoate decarboxylase|nr:amidohydrolase family protein [Spongiibacteraceae bacterium]
MTGQTNKNGIRTDVGYKRIATEEAFITRELLDIYVKMLKEGSHDDPGFGSLWGFYATNLQAERPRIINERLQDIGERRIADMDAAGIDVAILSLTSPGVQILPRDLAIAQARLANDQLADAVRKYPDRFAGLVAVAPQAPEEAAKELERGIKELGFKGVIINSHTQGEYLSDQKFWPILEAAEACDAPIYLHPNTLPKGMVEPFIECGLDGAIFGFGVETSFHMLRIITSGALDRFPNLKFVLGHLGEALQYWMWRIDYMHEATVRSKRYESLKPLKKKPSDYLKENVWITTSGQQFEPAIKYAQEVLGKDRVMYAMDYPYQYVPQEVADLDNMDMSPEDLKAFYQTNAEKLFKL